MFMSPPSTACAIDNVNSRAFLKLLRWLDYPRDDDNVYYVTYGGSTFSDLTKHPNTPHTKWGRTSTAAGAYQIVVGTWLSAKRNGIANDFMPASQDKIAWWIIGQMHAQAAVCGGVDKLDDAYKALRSQWSSLPGAGQNQVSAAGAKSRYEQYVKDAAEAAARAKDAVR